MTIKQKLTFNIINEIKSRDHGYKIYRINDQGSSGYSFLRLPNGAINYKAGSAETYIIDLPSPSDDLSRQYTESNFYYKENGEIEKTKKKGLNFSEKVDLRTLSEELAKYENVRSAEDISEELKLFFASCEQRSGISSELVDLSNRVLNLASKQVFDLFKKKRKEFLKLGLKDEEKFDEDYYEKVVRCGSRVNEQLAKLAKIKSKLLELASLIESDQRRMETVEWKGIMSEVEEIMSGKKDDYLTASEIFNLVDKVNNFFARYSSSYFSGEMPGEKLTNEVKRGLLTKLHELETKLRGDRKELKEELKEREQRGEKVENLVNILDEIKTRGDSATVKDFLQERDRRNQELAEQVEMSEAVSEAEDLTSDLDTLVEVAENDGQVAETSISKVKDELTEIKKQITANITNNVKSNADLYRKKEELERKLEVLNESKENNVNLPERKKTIATTIRNIAEKTRNFLNFWKKGGSPKKDKDQAKNISRAKNLRTKIDNVLNRQNTTAISVQESQELKTLSQQLSQVITSYDNSFTPQPTDNKFPWKAVAPIGIAVGIALIAWLVIKKKTSKIRK